MGESLEVTNQYLNSLISYYTVFETEIMRVQATQANMYVNEISGVGTRLIHQVFL